MKPLLDVPSANAATAYHDRFPAKLHYLLEQVERDGDKSVDVIAWQPHGRSFLVKDRQKFVQAFLPTWFRQTTWASFLRQLSLYEFKRITSGPDKNSYYHPCFVKNDRTLCKYIRRVALNGNGRRRASKAEDQPNFYGVSLPRPFPRVVPPPAAVDRPAGPPLPRIVAAAPPPLTEIHRVTFATHWSMPFAPALPPTMQSAMPGWSTPGGWPQHPSSVALNDPMSFLFMLQVLVGNACTARSP